MSRFSADTAVTALGDGRYSALIDRGWWIERGPNGGYLAAIVLRAILAEVADPARPTRSLTLHYLRPPVEGPCSVDVTIERAGRGMSTVSARLHQDGRTCILALAALGGEREGIEIHDITAPVLEPPAEDYEQPMASPVPLGARYVSRPMIGTMPFVLGDEALTGGWIRTADADPVDEVLIAALTDAWPPAVFSRAAAPVGVPTIDLTIHFRQRPTPGETWSIVQFRTTLVTEGYLEEDGEVWSADGRLLAQSRQLAVVVAPN